MLSFTSANRLVKFSAKSANEEMHISVFAELIRKQKVPQQCNAKPLFYSAKAFAICAMILVSFAVAFVYPAMKQISLSMKQICSATIKNKHAMMLINPAIPLFDLAMRQQTTAMRQINLAISQFDPENMERCVEMIDYQIVIKNHIGNKFLFLFRIINNNKLNWS